MAIFGNSKKGKIVGVIDIGSASVGGAVVSINGDGNPKLLYSTRHDLVFQSNLNFGRFLSSMLDALEQTLHDIEHASQETPRDFFCSFASPWYASRTKTLQISYESPVTISDKVLGKLIRDEVGVFETDMKESSAIANDPPEVIDMDTIQVRLNGYETANPRGKRAKEIELALYASISSQRVLESIKSRIFKAFHTRRVVFGTYTLVAFSAIRDIFSDKKNFLFLDITGEVSDFSIIRDNVIAEVVSFPMGKNSLIRRIASGLNVGPAEALSLIRMREEQHQTKVAAKKLDGIIDTAKQEWLKYFTGALNDFAEKYAVPATIFLTIDQDVSSIYIEAIQTEDLGQFVLTENAFNVSMLNGKVLEKFLTIGDGVVHDPFLFLETIFVDKVSEKFK